MREKVPWVLLRGLTRESGHWGDFPKRLSDADNGASVVCMDLPGNGFLCRAASPTTVEAMADYCHLQWRAGNPEQPVRLLAMSLGAMVAAAWAQRYPADVSCMVLINTSMRPFSPFYHRLRPSSYLRLLALAIRASKVEASERIEAEILGLTSNRQWQGEQRADILRAWCALRQRHPVSGRNALNQLLAAARFRAPMVLPSPLRSTLRLLVGAGDRLVDPRCSAALSRAWSVPLRSHPVAGHDLPLDDPDWVISQALQVREVLTAVLPAPIPDASA